MKTLRLPKASQAQTLRSRRESGFPKSTQQIGLNPKLEPKLTCAYYIAPWYSLS